MIAARLIWRMVSMDAHGIRIVIKKMRTISTTIIVAKLRKRNVTLVWLDTVLLMQVTHRDTNMVQDTNRLSYQAILQCPTRDTRAVTTNRKMMMIAPKKLKKRKRQNRKLPNGLFLSLERPHQNRLQLRKKEVLVLSLNGVILILVGDMDSAQDWTPTTNHAFQLFHCLIKDARN